MASLHKHGKILRVFFLTALLSILIFYLLADVRFSAGFMSFRRSTMEQEKASLLVTPTAVLMSSTTEQSDGQLCHVMERGQYIRVGHMDVAILTAVQDENPKDKEGVSVYLNGWARINSPMNFKCCFLNYLNATDIQLVETPSTVYHFYRQWRVEMQSAEFNCYISGEELEFNLPIINLTNFITFAENSCQDAPKQVLRIERSTKIPKSVGVCLKISYGFLEPELVVEWFEFQRMIGVTKVFTFMAEDLTEEVRKVFAYYVSIGFLETNPIDPAPRYNGTRRGFRKPRWEQQAWIDEVTAINDCKYRMAGLDFILVHDMDELIIPKHSGQTIHDILTETLTKSPATGAFIFDSHITVLDWGPTRLSPLHIMRTTNVTTRANYDGADRNTRWGFVSDRVAFVQNNKAWTGKGFDSTKVNGTLYSLIHRRLSKPQWKGCKSMSIRRRDKSLVQYEDQLLQRVRGLPLESILGDRSAVYMNGIQAGQQTET